MYLAGATVKMWECHSGVFISMTNFTMKLMILHRADYSRLRWKCSWDEQHEGGSSAARSVPASSSYLHNQRMIVSIRVRVSRAGGGPMTTGLKPLCIQIPQQPEGYGAARPSTIILKVKVSSAPPESDPKWVGSLPILHTTHGTLHVRQCQLALPEQKTEAHAVQYNIRRSLPKPSNQDELCRPTPPCSS